MDDPDKLRDVRAQRDSAAREIERLEKICATLWSVLSGSDKLWEEANRKVASQTNPGKP